MPLAFVFRRPGALWLLPSLLCLAFASYAQGQSEAPTRASKPETIAHNTPAAELIRFPIGRTNEGTPIDAWVLPADTGGDTDDGDAVDGDAVDRERGKLRLLLVGESAAAARRIREMVKRFYASDRNSSPRKALRVTAVPRMLPDRPDAAEVSFPPAGTAYVEPLGGAPHYLWRWIGMHAPDLVLVVRSEQPEQSETSWFVPVADFPGWSGLRQALRPAAEGSGDELCAALVSHAACDTGRIPALRVNLGAEDSERLLQDLLNALREAGFQGPSPARAELARRAARSSRETAERLAQHYGHDLSQVVYIPALALVGRLRLAELTGDAGTRADVERIVGPYFTGQRDSAPKNGSALSGHLIFTELAARSEGAQRERYLTLVRQAADLAFETDGRPRGSMPFHLEMSDSLFMGGPILAEAGWLTGEARYYEACLRHLRFMRERVLRDDGLYRHSPLDEAAWGRGNGFPALGLAWCLSCWPEERADRKELLRMFRDHMAALAGHQDMSGCWHQVIDRPDSYRELSCTCMITFALARGIRLGWLDRETYLPLVNKAWRAIRLRVGDDGGLVDVCTGTGKQTSLDAYYHRSAILGRDPRGGAMALLVATEMMRLEKDAAQNQK